MQRRSVAVPSPADPFWKPLYRTLRGAFGRFKNAGVQMHEDGPENGSSDPLFGNCARNGARLLKNSSRVLGMSQLQLFGPGGVGRGMKLGKLASKQWHGSFPLAIIPGWCPWLLPLAVSWLLA